MYCVKCGERSHATKCYRCGYDLTKDFISFLSPMNSCGFSKLSETYDVSEIKTLTGHPSKEEFNAMILSSMNVPIYRLVNVMTGILRSLLYALKEIQKTKEQSNLY
ncbi:MAG TPA: hypothetical protein DIW17_06915 [Clostridiales bacterium]|nr:hypothetical protein [Clostridiales bacterium]